MYINRNQAVRAGMLALLMVPSLVGCGAEAPGPLAVDGEVELSLSGLRPLDPIREGTYAAWGMDRAGEAHALGGFALPADGRVVLRRPAAALVTLEVTVEPPGDTDPGPSAERLLTGALRGTRAELTVEGAVTQGTLPLRERPGQFTMYFSPSDNAIFGFPSHEESGVWLFNIAPRQTEKENGWVYLSQLRDGWTYEGWVVRDYGTANAIWLSYGKFRPDTDGALRSRDDTGWGPFSGVRDFRTAGEEEYPGDDWISNPLGHPWPAELALPLDLREATADGRPRWTHLITVEPRRDAGEGVMQERPFLLQPYRDSFQPRVDGVPRPYGLPQAITLRAEALPRAAAVVR